MGCYQSKRRAAQQAVEGEIEEQERGRSGTNIGEENVNPLRPKNSATHSGNTVANPTFRLAGLGGSGGNDGSKLDAPSVTFSGHKTPGGVEALESSNFKKRASQRANAAAKKYTAALLTSMPPVVEQPGSLPSAAAEPLAGASSSNIRRKQSVYNGFQEVDETDGGDGSGSDRNGNTMGLQRKGKRVVSVYGGFHNVDETDGGDGSGSDRNGNTMGLQRKGKRVVSVYGGFHNVDETDGGDGSSSDRNGNTIGLQRKGKRVVSVYGGFHNVDETDDNDGGMVDDANFGDMPLLNTADAKLGVGLMKKDPDGNGKRAAIKSMNADGQAAEKCTQGQVITHINDTAITAMRVEEKAALITKATKVTGGGGGSEVMPSTAGNAKVGIRLTKNLAGTDDAARPPQPEAASPLDSSEMAAVGKLYDAMDADGDGEVTQIEFAEFLRVHKPSSGPFSTVAALQGTFGLKESPAISRGAFLAVFAREKENGLDANLFLTSVPNAAARSILANAYGASVEEMLGTIAAEHPTIAKQFKQCSTGSKTIPPEVVEVYVHQGLDAVGVLYGGLREAQKQLDDLNANPIRALGAAGKEAKAIWKKRTSDLKEEIAVFNSKLNHCHAVYCETLKIPLDTTEANLPTLKKGMPVAATATGDSMQRLLGKLWLIDKSAAASGNKRLQQLVKKKLNTALGKYDAARNEATGIVVPLVLGDVGKYQDELDQILATGGSGGGPVDADVLRGLEELKTSIVPLADGEALRLTADPRAPDPFDPAYLVYSRLLASETSPVLYRRICKIIKDTGCNAIAVPGGVKGEARMVFKTLTSYGGDFSKCRDISRITVVVATMRDLWIVAQALQRDGEIRTIRGKFRFSPDYDPVPTGGYRDTQYQVFVAVGGIWRYAEVQLNLHPFMMLKNQKDAGHGAFNKARAIAAYSDATLRFTGAPSTGLWAKVQEGMLMYVSLNGSELSAENMAGFDAAVVSSKCRLRALSFQHCSVDRLSAEKEATFPWNLFSKGEVVAGMQASGLKLDMVGANFAMPHVLTACAMLFSGVPLNAINLKGAGLNDADVQTLWDALKRHVASNQSRGADLVVDLKNNDFSADLKVALAEWSDETKRCTVDVGIGEDLFNGHLPPSLRVFDWKKQTKLGDIGNHDPEQFNLLLQFRPDIEEMNFGSCYATDNIVAAIGQGLATNKSLATLHLENNSIGDAGAAAIGQGLATNETLKNITLDGNNITATGWNAIAEAMATNGRLIDMFDLHSKGIDDTGAAAIGQGLATNKSLATLDLRKNKIGDAGAAAIGQGLATNKTLATLNLSSNSIGDTGAAAIVQGLATNKTLAMLNLSGNSIGDTGAAAIGQGLATNKTLATLDLSYNRIGAVGAAAIGQGLATNKALATLNLHGNSIGAAGAAAIGQGLATNKTLATLDLYGNSIGAAGAAAIGQGLATNKTLATLDLRNNRFGDAGAAAIGQGLATNKALATLHLYDNNIGAAGAAAIGQGLATNATLATLELAYNSIGDAGAAAIGQGLATNKTLKTLNLWHNDISSAAEAALTAAAPHVEIEF